MFDGVGGASIDLGLALLRRGGTLVTYANPGNLRRLPLLLRKMLLVGLSPNGKTLNAYPTSTTFANRQPLSYDWARLHDLLARGAMQPVIHRVLPLQDPAEANARLESGAVTGNLVLRTAFGERVQRHRGERA